VWHNTVLRLALLMCFKSLHYLTLVTSLY